jgi:hypothetical protein
MLKVPTHGWKHWPLLGGVLLLLGSALPARAGESGPAEPSTAPVTAPVNLSLGHRLSTNQLVGPRVRNFLSLGLGIDRPYQLRGLQAALGAAYVERSAYGVQLAVGLSATGDEVAGIQWGGFGAFSGGSVFGLQATAGVAMSGERIRVFDEQEEGRPTGSRVVGIQLGGLGALGMDEKGLYGLQAAGVFAMEASDLWGIQASGLFAYASRGHGMQVAGLIGGMRSFEGLQLSGALSVAKERGVGIQVAGLVNSSPVEHVGLQVAPVNLGAWVRGVQLGLVNRADSVTGVQLGLVNLADNGDGVRLGLVNLARGIPSAVEAWATELVPVSAAWRTGTHSLHSLVGVGVMALGGPRPLVLAGLGTSVDLWNGVAFFPDLVYSHSFRFAPVGTAAQVLQVRMPVRWGLEDKLWMEAGLTLNAGRFVESTPGYLPYLASTEVGSRTVRVWPGALVGVGFTLPWPGPIVYYD